MQLGDGRVAVADEGNSRVAFFAPDGGFVSSTGREGEGPGEFTRVSILERWVADSLLAWDLVQRRFTVLAPDGTFARNFTFTLTDEVVFASTRDVFEDGSILASGFVDAPDVIETGVGRYPSPYYHFDSEGTLITELGDFVGGETYYLVRGNGGFTAFEPFFGRRAHHIAASHLLLAVSDSYELRYHTPDGAPQLIVRWLRPAVAVTSEDVAKATEDFVDNAPEERRAEQRAMASDIPVPETMPAFDRIFVDRTGRTWVEEYDADEGDPSVWTLFGPDGSLAARTEPPRRFTPLDAGADYVLGVLRDELDVEHLILARASTP